MYQYDFYSIKQNLIGLGFVELLNNKMVTTRCPLFVSVVSSGAAGGTGSAYHMH